MKPWTAAAFALGTVLYVVAISNEIYALTSPPALSWHVLLRKTYSVVAFTLFAYLAGRAIRENGGRPTAGLLSPIVGAYSFAIEVGQAVAGSREGPLWQTIDVACGALGGVLGAAVLARVKPARARATRPH